MYPRNQTGESSGQASQAPKRKKIKAKVGLAEKPQVVEIEVPEQDLPVWDLDAKLSVVGKRVPRIEGPEKVTGEAKYTLDYTPKDLPGLLYGKVLRSPYAHARVESIDASKAKAQNRPPIVAELEKKYGRDLKNGGAVYVGDKGIMISGNYAGSPRIVPEQKHKEFPLPPKKLPRLAKGLTHQTDFLRACRDGKPSSSDFSYGGALSEVVLLGCLAIRAGVGNKVEWDGEKMQCTNLPELNRLVKREYRSGWGM